MRTQTDATDAMARTHKVHKSFSPNPTKATNAMGGERKNKGGEHKISPISRSNVFPHKEERLISRIVDLDLLSLFP
jgi:hypothetical protein